MKKLDGNQMESLNGGITLECAGAIAGLAGGFAAAFFVTTPIGAGIFLASFVGSSLKMAHCN